MIHWGLPEPLAVAHWTCDKIEHESRCTRGQRGLLSWLDLDRSSGAGDENFRVGVWGFRDGLSFGHGINGKFAVTLASGVISRSAERHVLEQHPLVATERQKRALLVPVEQMARDRLCRLFWPSKAMQPGAAVIMLEAGR